MKKLAVTALSLFLVLNLSQAKTIATAQVQESPKLSVSRTPTQTKSVRVLATKKVQRRLLVTNDLSNGDDGPPGSDELDLQSPYRRPRVCECQTPVADDDLSEYAQIRLAVARARAIEVYRQKWV